MDKCIKIELPTGQALLENFKPVDERSKEIIKDYIGDYDFAVRGSKHYEGWVVILSCDCGYHFKVIAQYGDEFPV